MIGAALPRTQPTGADVTLRFTGVEIYRVCERWREAREKSGGGEGASLCSNSNQVGRVDAGWICPTRRELPQTCTPESLSMVWDVGWRSMRRPMIATVNVHSLPTQISLFHNGRTNTDPTGTVLNYPKSELNRALIPKHQTQTKTDPRISRSHQAAAAASSAPATASSIPAGSEARMWSGVTPTRSLARRSTRSGLGRPRRAGIMRPCSALYLVQFSI